MALGAAAAFFAAWLAVKVNLDRACVIGDTPYLDLCTPAPDRTAQLRTRIAANPGDTAAYVELALSPRSAQQARALSAAVLLAPSDPRLQKLEAARALERNDVNAAVAMLVKIVENHVQEEPATLALAKLLLSGQSPALEAHLQAGAQWPQRVLGRLSQAGGSISSALPLVSRALAAGALDPAAVTAYIARMKDEGALTDAHTLWVTLHGRTLPLLYNGGFDQPFVMGGFDWEPHAQAQRGRAGAVVDRSGAEGRGGVLDIRLTGRPIALPMISQLIMAGDGPLRLQGEYRAMQMRMDPGIAWVVRCTTGPGQVIFRSTGFTDTGNAWKTFEHDFEVPPECGNIVRLELGTIATASPAAAELASGRGRIWFDNLALLRRPR